jgi:hypothetical protein
VRPLPGGGKAYDYGAATQLMPPPHFNVLKASDKQLQEYGLPTRQRLGSRWRAAARHMLHFIRPTPYLVELPPANVITRRVPALSACSNCSPNWEGYGAIHGHAYTYVAAGWFEPDFLATSCSTTTWVQWTGIGGWNTGDLGQDGTAFGSTGIGQHQAWIETTTNGDFDGIIAVDLTAPVGTKVSAGTQWDSGATKYIYGITDSNGQLVSLESRAVGSANDLSSAEVITERTSPSPNVYYDLSHFEQFQLENTVAGWSNGTDTFYDLDNNGDATFNNMVDSNNNVMAFPGPLNTSSDFSSTWNRCN